MMNQYQRNPSYAKVELQVIDLTAVPDSTLTDSGHAPFSDVTKTPALPAISKLYATLEQDRLPVDGSQYIMPDSGAYAPQGYCSDVLSQADCTFATDPVVSISFGSTHSLLGFTLVFDNLSNSFCTDFIVRSYAGATLLSTHSVTGNTATQYMFTDGFTGINKVTVEFVKANRPNNRVHLFGLAFGLIKTYTNDDFLDDGVSQDMAADPISSELPTAQLAFSVNNYDGSYNPDSPSGVYAALQQEQAVILNWGRDVGDSAIEWMPGGRFYLTDWMAPANKQSATFTANSLLDFMQATYPRGVYAPSGASLYNLALAVLQYYGLPKQPDGSNPWVLDSSLQSIYTTAPLPAQAGRELLQLIANAAMCVLSIDRQGRICIGPASTVDTGYLLPLDLAMEYPENTLTTPLQEVDVNLYAYAPASASSTIYTGTYAVNGTQTIHIDYSGSAAANVSASVSGGTLVSANYYAYSCDLTITGTGSVTVTLTGYALQSTTSVVAYAPGGSGEVCPVDNALITDPANAANVAQWAAAYLSSRRTYTEDYRGEPALDAGDLIDLQTQYTDALRVRVLETVLKFQQGLTGTLTMKGMS